MGNVRGILLKVMMVFIRYTPWNRFLKKRLPAIYQKMLFLAIQGMRSVFLAIFLVFFMLPSCSPKSGSGKKVVKPKYHHRWYDRKKDRHKPRTKQMKVKN
jgi:hypothetical protein